MLIAAHGNSLRALVKHLDQVSDAEIPKVEIPTLVIWGMRDVTLLPVQLEGLDRLVTDLQVVRLPDAGHFAPWEAPEAVAGALAPFLAGEAVATAAPR